ncbi:MAG: hypothetical protein ACI9HK_006014, partial [Pirellulaceae bacterium]
MAFVNLSLLAGALLVSVPIIIHLVMRQEPQKLMFPALRFLLARKETNRRKLQLRHWILLFLRAAAIGVLALTLARPSVAAAVVGDWIVVAGVGVLFVGLAALAGISYWQDRGRAFVFGFAAASGVLAAIFIWLLASAIGAGGDGLIGDPDAPVAAVFVIDNAPRMEYRSENKTRLEKAKDDALWLLKRLPKGSEVAVVDARPGSAVFSVDLGAAESAVDRLKWTAVPRAMVEMLDNAFKLVSKKVDLRKEIYILSDLSKVAWTEKVDPTLAKRLTESEDIAVYVIDVGVREIQNVALGDLELSAQSIPKNSDLILNTTVRRNGPETERKIQVYIESQDPTRPFIENGELKLPDTELRNERIVKLADGDSQVLQIQLSGLGIGVHHGWIEVVGEDGLAIDDRRYFSIDVSDAWPILVVAPPDVYWQAYTEAIAPYEFRKTERTRFECVVVEPADLANQNFEDYAAICLLDPTPMPPTTWERFGRYVREGGSMGIFLGHHAIQSSSFNQPAAQQLLPG